MGEKGFITEFKEGYRDELNLPERVKVFDTTLRDGEQTPGVSFTPDQKIRIARQLDELGVDVIEAGFPIVSEGEDTSVKDIAEEGLDAEVCALARTSKSDVEAALDCNVDSLHIFIATSDLHLEKKLEMTQEEVLQNAVEAVQYAKDQGMPVEFSAEDATRTSLGFLKEIYRGVEEAGDRRVELDPGNGRGEQLHRRLAHDGNLGVKNLDNRIERLRDVLDLFEDRAQEVAEELAGVDGDVGELDARLAEAAVLKLPIQIEAGGNGGKVGAAGECGAQIEIDVRAGHPVVAAELEIENVADGVELALTVARPGTAKAVTVGELRSGSGNGSSPSSRPRSRQSRAASRWRS